MDSNDVIKTILFLVFAVVVVSFIVIHEGTGRIEKNDRLQVAEFFLQKNMGKPRQLALLKNGLGEIQIQSEGKFSVSGTYLLIGGTVGGSGKIKNQEYLYFAWNTKGSSYLISKIPLAKVEFLAVENNQPQTISFAYSIEKYERYTNWNGPSENLQDAIDSAVTKVIIRVHNKNLPMETF